MNNEMEMNNTDNNALKLNQWSANEKPAFPCT